VNTVKLIGKNIDKLDIKFGYKADISDLEEFSKVVSICGNLLVNQINFDFYPEENDILHTLLKSIRTKSLISKYILSEKIM
jgi:hypothetical protein